MARARNIKPGFFKNEDLAECSFPARLCFAGLWTLADREGRLEDRPKRIKGELFAFDSVEVEPLLAELAKHGFITRYTIADGRSVIQIIEFLKHQHPHQREPESELPPHQSTGLCVDATTQKPSADRPSQEIKAPDKPETSRQKADIAGGVNRAESPISESGALNPPSPTPESEVGAGGTDYGTLSKAIRQAGIGDASPGHLRFRALVDAGADLDEFLAFVPQALKADKPFAYLLGAVWGERERATQSKGQIHQGVMPKAPITVESKAADKTQDYLREQFKPLTAEEKAASDIARKRAMSALGRVT